MNSEEFRDFASTLIKIILHMELSEPSIEFWSTEKLIYKKFRKSDFYCIDGFPKDDLPCVIVF